MIDPEYPNISKFLLESWALVHIMGNPTFKMIEYVYEHVGILGAKKIFNKTDDDTIRTYLLMKFPDVLEPIEENLDKNIDIEFLEEFIGKRWAN